MPKKILTAAVVEDFFSRLRVPPCTEAATYHAADIPAVLEKTGQPIGINDAGPG